MWAISDQVQVAIVGALGVVAVALITGMFAVLISRPIKREVKSAITKVEAVETKVDAVHATAKQVDSAVNGQPFGFPTLVQRVVDRDDREMHKDEELADDRAWNYAAMEALAKRMGIELPPAPPPVEARLPVVTSDS